MLQYAFGVFFSGSMKHHSCYARWAASDTARGQATYGLDEAVVDGTSGL
jgi:hypothetical protein